MSLSDVGSSSEYVLIRPPWETEGTAVVGLQGSSSFQHPKLGQASLAIPPFSPQVAVCSCTTQPATARSFHQSRGPVCGLQSGREIRAGPLPPPSHLARLPLDKRQQDDNTDTGQTAIVTVLPGTPDCAFLVFALDLGLLSWPYSGPIPP
ncbi:hypothetical protein ColLi_10213 [Colletotrichum liriopes]|uniref:Uncharacterized protein n=1 Tax=Colletotrichum liriopes TaxID=708192 RepID=A0AA37GV70_9PEZI|nr:hypothetical protein ColLi_10213 [Colletotrichum liriopes]